MLTEILQRSASLHADRPALVEGGRCFSYGQLGAVVAGLASRLRELDLPEGAVLAVQMANSVEMAASLFAAEGLGWPVLLLDPALKGEEVARYCRLAGSMAVLRREGEPDPECPVPSLPVPAAEALGERGLALSVAAEDRPADGTLFLLLSAGTTGPPKAVPRTAAQVAAALRIFRETAAYSADDRVLGVLPFSHSYGLLNVLLSSLAAGAAVHVARFSPRESVARVERKRITVLPGTPFMFRMLVETRYRQRPDFSSVRLAVSVGSALSAAVAQGFREGFGVGICQSYGTTESGPVALARPEERFEGQGWVGRPYCGVRVEVRDGTGQPVESDQPGQIWVESPANAKAYLHDPAASSSVFKDGYVVTGDVGRMGAGGHLFVLGRERPMLTVAGKKVAPAEVEACLMTHPAVADALVVGEEAFEGEDRVKAYVVRAAEVTALELQEFCGKRLADFKVPRHVVFVEDLSRGAMGKTQAPQPPQPGG